MPGKLPDQILECYSGRLECREPAPTTGLGFRAIQKIATIHARFGRAKVRDRGEVGAEEKIRFTSSILPKWARRTKSLSHAGVRQELAQGYVMPLARRPRFPRRAPGPK